MHSVFLKFSMAVIFMAGVLPASGALAQKSPSLSTDQLLEYSLDSLRSKMDAAVQENQKLSAKNSSIRKRILFLKKELRELDDELIALKEGVVDIKNGIKLDAKELKVEEKHLNNVLERKRYLTFERDMLKKQMETLVLEQDMLEKDADETSFDIKELKGDSTGPVSGSLLDYYAEEKIKFLDMVADYRARIDEKRNKIDKVDLAIADELRMKETALRKQESFERAVADWELQLKEEEARKALLNKSTQYLGKVLKSDRQSIELQNQNKRKYIRELVKIIKSLKIAQQDMSLQFESDEKEMRRYISFLNDENEQLFRYYDKVEGGFFLEQKKDAEDHATLLLGDQQREGQKSREQLRSERDQLENDFLKQKQSNESLRRDEERLQKSLKDLASRLEKAKKSVAVVREDAFGKKRAELERALREQHMLTKKIEEEVQTVKAGMEDQRQQLMVTQGRTLSLEDDLDQQKKALEGLDISREGLLKQQNEFFQLADRNIETFKKEITDTIVHKKVLTASVDVIHKKYKAGEGALMDFEAEQAELSRYLDILKKENQSLQKKMSDLKSNEQ